MFVHRRAVLAASVLSLGIATALGARPTQAPTSAARMAAYPFNLPAQPLAQSLRAIARQTGTNVLFDAKDVDGLTAPALHATLTAHDAIARVLGGTGLSLQPTAPSTVIIRPAGGDPPSSGSDGPQATVSPKKETMSDSVTGRPEAKDGAAAVSAPSTLDTIVVTGTRIRGGTTASPTITLTAQTIREAGFSDLGEVVRALPQNFSGGQNPGVSSGNLSGAGNANQNITGGSSLNLRGLGPDATLTLLNGRRLSYSGFVQSVDISAIPVDAVERVEIVTDGASAIYGSDAVGGVANVILKPDYDGVSVGTRYAGATAGGLTSRNYTATAGKTWTTGGLIATYQHTSTDPIYASQRPYTDHLTSPTTIYPRSDLGSGLVSVHQAVGEHTEWRLDLLRSRRDQAYAYYYGGVNRIASQTTSTLIAPGVDIFRPHDWMLTLGATWAKDQSEQYQGRQSAATGVTGVVTDACFCNTSRAYEASVEGPLFTLAGGDARLATGLGYRTNAFVWKNHATATNTARGDEGVKFAYAELNLPLIGQEQGLTGVRRLALTAAVRTEDYDSFGRVTTPKLGLLYDPTADVTFKASWGKSFKAPTLFERDYPQSLLLYTPAYFGGQGYPSDATALYLSGGNPQLKPERARTWTASLAFHPEAIPDMDAELTWFHIDYAHRVIQPISNATQSLGNAVYGPFIAYAPSEAEQAQLISRVGTLTNWNPAAYDPRKVVAILYAQYQNVSRQNIKGLDLSGSYRVAVGPGQLTLRGAATWLDSVQQNAINQPYADLSGTLFHPARLTARAGAVWNQGGFSASAFVHYTDGVKDVAAHRKTASFTTVDATLRYLMGERAGVWSGLEFTLSGQNVLNRRPPLHHPTLAAYAVPYDSTNYSPIGRYLSLAIAKRW